MGGSQAPRYPSPQPLLGCQARPDHTQVQVSMAEEAPQVVVFRPPQFVSSVRGATGVCTLAFPGGGLALPQFSGGLPSRKDKVPAGGRHLHPSHRPEPLPRPCPASSPSSSSGPSPLRPLRPLRPCPPLGAPRGPGGRAPGQQPGCGGAGSAPRRERPLALRPRPARSAAGGRSEPFPGRYFGPLCEPRGAGRPAALPVIFAHNGSAMYGNY